MIEIKYHNDGKEKAQSHEVSIKEENFYNSKLDLCSHNPFDITGYGATKKEALEDFKKKYAYIVRELEAFETMLFETDVLTEKLKD